MINKEFKTLRDLIACFSDEQSCIDHLELLRWGGNVVSPFDNTSKVYKCKDNKYRCKNSGKYFNVKTNTLFDNTKVSLKSWFLAIWLVTSHKKGISSVQLAIETGVTQKTAWFMLQRIRKCFGCENDEQLENEVEIDETFVGGKNKNRHKDKKVTKCQGRSFKDKTPVFGMLERGYKIIAKVVANTKANTLLPLIHQYVSKGAKLYTDEWNYGNVDNFYDRQQVNHGAHYYGSGNVTTNSIEGFWSIFKRGIVGIYQSVSRKHLQRYVDEFVFRYNTRKLTQYVRFNYLLCNTEHRLTYKILING